VHLLTSGMPGPDLLEAYVRCGSKDRAVRLLDELAPVPCRPARSARPALFLRCRALVGGDGADADYDAALQRHADVQAPFEAGPYPLVFGEHLRRNRDVVAARRILAEATEAFAQTRRAAVGTQSGDGSGGVHPRPRRPREAAPCRRAHPQELRVALAVAQGATSRRQPRRSSSVRAPSSTTWGRSTGSSGSAPGAISSAASPPTPSSGLERRVAPRVGGEEQPPPSGLRSTRRCLAVIGGA